MSANTPNLNVMDLHNQIQACANRMIAKRRASPDQQKLGSDRTALLFTGLNQHQVPHDLLFDPHLSPNEKNRLANNESAIRSFTSRE